MLQTTSREWLAERNLISCSGNENRLSDLAVRYLSVYVALRPSLVPEDVLAVLLPRLFPQEEAVFH